MCAVERDAYCASVLAQRQNDGALPVFPIWSDVTTFDGRPWRGIVDVVSGGFPCQDISAAGSGDGLEGKRSGLWSHMARIIREIRPRRVFVENSPMLTARGLGRVLGDLAEMGFDARWGCLSAADTGAPHKRDRFWLVADTDGMWELQQAGQGKERHRVGHGSHQVAHTNGQCLQGVEPGGTETERRTQTRQRPTRSCRYEPRGWPTEPGMGRVADGMANRLDRIKALGNGQVSRVAATAFDCLR
ncbi:DNA cytosine methyltransferase [Kushneria sp. AK178]